MRPLTTTSRSSAWIPQAKLLGTPLNIVRFNDQSFMAVTNGLKHKYDCILNEWQQMFDPEAIEYRNIHSLAFDNISNRLYFCDRDRKTMTIFDIDDCKQIDTIYSISATFG